MDQKARIAPELLSHQVQSHHSIPGHEAAMNADQNRSALARHVIQPFDLNAPVIVMQELEERSAVCRDIALLLEEELRERFGGRALRRTRQLASNLLVRDGPGVAYIVELLYRVGQAEA